MSYKSVVTAAIVVCVMVVYFPGCENKKSNKKSNPPEITSTTKPSTRAADNSVPPDLTDQIVNLLEGRNNELEKILWGEKATGDIGLYGLSFRLPAESGKHELCLRVIYRFKNGIISHLEIIAFDDENSQTALEGYYKYLNGLGKTFRICYKERESNEMFMEKVKLFNKLEPGLELTKRYNYTLAHPELRAIRPMPPLPAFCLKPSCVDRKFLSITVDVPYTRAADGRRNFPDEKEFFKFPTTAPNFDNTLAGVPAGVGDNLHLFLATFFSCDLTMEIILRNEFPLALSSGPTVVCKGARLCTLEGFVVRFDFFFPLSRNNDEKLLALKKDIFGEEANRLHESREFILPGGNYQWKWRRARYIRGGDHGIGVTFLLKDAKWTGSVIGIFLEGTEEIPCRHCTSKPAGGQN